MSNNLTFDELAAFVLSKPTQKIELNDVIILDTHVFTQKSVERVKSLISQGIKPSKDRESRVLKLFLIEIHEKIN